MLFFIIISGVVLIFACGQSHSEEQKKSSEKSRIIVWAWDPTYNIKALEIAQEYSDVELDIVEMSQKDILQRLYTSIASGKMEGLPSIVLMGDYNVDNMLSVNPDAFEDLSDMMDADLIPPSRAKIVEKDGKIYGIPFESGVAGLFYRVDYLKEAGYSPEDLENITWDQYIEIGKSVKEKTGKAMLVIDPNDQMLLRLMMVTAGEWYTSADQSKITIEDNDALREGIRVICRMMNEGIAVGKSGWDAGVEAVNTGEAATVLSGSWYSSSIMSARDQSGKWRIAPFPRFSNVPSVNASDLGGSNWFVLKGNNSGVAKQFLRDTFSSNKELLDRLTNEIGLVSALKLTADTDANKQKVPFYDNQRVYEDFSKWMKEIPDIYYGNHIHEVEKLMIPYIARAVQGEDLAGLLQEAQKQANDTINQTH